MSLKKSIILCILDGWGINKINNYKFDATSSASTPNFDYLKKNFPMTELSADGENVGLPNGQMGNSEVGHQTIGSGRITLMNLPKINLDIKKSLIEHKTNFKKLIKDIQLSGGVVHILGLISSGGVHGHRDHLVAFANKIAENKLKVKIHGFLDGRDGPLKSAENDLKVLIKKLRPEVSISSLSGRYYGMDRDNRWDRTKICYDAIMFGKAKKSLNFLKDIKESYKKGTTDEFFVPMCNKEYNGVQSKKDGILFLNFRSDRIMQLFSAMCYSEFNSFPIKKRPFFKNISSIVEYSKNYNFFSNILYSKEILKDTLGECISKNKMKQLRLSETEKFPHVTYFFSGGKEESFINEYRCHIPSPKVSTYDVKPDMSARNITIELKKIIDKKKYDFILVNFANPDMVGHTGNFSATIKACEVVDEEIGKIFSYIKNKNIILILTSDHGNSEKMFDEKNNMPHTSHTLNKVPFIIVGLERNFSLSEGGLSDIAPTILSLLRIKKPTNMTGVNLIS